MNILKARNQLHQIAKNNPELDHFAHFQPTDLSPDAHMANTWKAQRHPKILHAHHMQAHLFKNETIKTIPQKTNNQEKVQVKTPIFKNKKGENFSSSQKQRFQKLGLQNFLKQSLLNQKSNLKSEEPIEQKIIKNLNNTYFRSTQHIHGKRKNMVNSLGIKKSSMSNYKVDWDEKNMSELEIEWKYIGYIPNKVFPCRKNTSVKNKIYTPKKKESPQKDIQNFGEKIKSHETSLMEKTSSVNFLQSKDLGPKHSLLNLNQKVNSLQSSRVLHKDKKIFIDTSKILNKSQEFIIKPEISRVFAVDKVRPISEKMKRPWTSKQALIKNQKISERLNSTSESSRKRRYSESTHRTVYTFKDSWKKEKPESKKSLMKNMEIEEGSDFIKGKKMSIHQVPEPRVMEYF